MVPGAKGGKEEVYSASVSVGDRDPTDDVVGVEKAYSGVAFCESPIVLSAPFRAGHVAEDPSPEGAMHSES